MFHNTKCKAQLGSVVFLHVELCRAHGIVLKAYGKVDSKWGQQSVEEKSIQQLGKHLQFTKTAEETLLVGS